jgi:hypothetical protein
MRQILEIYITDSEAPFTVRCQVRFCIPPRQCRLKCLKDMWSVSPKVSKTHFIVYDGVDCVIIQ